MQNVTGFSKFSKEEKIQWLFDNLEDKSIDLPKTLKNFWHRDKKTQEVFDLFSENTISNFYLPYGMAPNFLINNSNYCIPMCIEESSVVAAVSNAAKFWASRGGFKFEVKSMTKVGQVHFYWHGDPKLLKKIFPKFREKFEIDLIPITSNMVKRGGGVESIELHDLTDRDQGLFQIFVKFDTCDAMGANFINSCLESMSQSLEFQMRNCEELKSKEERQVDIVMSILSNYTPESIVHAEVECDLEDLNDPCLQMDAKKFSEKFQKAIKIANIDPHRATTHNKGIFNGIDAVVLATGNDFRAVEACAHTYAARDGQYKSLTNCEISNTKFRFFIDLPLSLGTTGGLTNLHPMAKTSLDVLGRPNAKELMGIVACVGLAQNFAAIKSLITTGIQKGHMKMHLLNILNQLNASKNEIEISKEYFSNHTVSYSLVRELIEAIREKEKIKNLH